MTHTIDSLRRPSPLRQPRDAAPTTEVTPDGAADGAAEVTPDKPPPTKPVGPTKGPDRPERPDTPRLIKAPTGPIRGA